MKSFLHFSKFKKIILVLLFAELMNIPAFANPGDTTWVTVYNARRLGHYGDFDTTAVFPTGKRYRKIRLHYILGRYACPAGTQYCGSWDYTTKLYVMPPANSGKDTVEIARVITPYASDWLSQQKKHEYILDVTDFATILEGTNGFRFQYQGYSWGFTITLKLEFIEGIPTMDALSVKNVYDGYFPYGAPATSTNNIENYLTEKTFTSYTDPVQYVYLRNTISGHGADAANCAEFCSKYYQLKIDGNQIAQEQLWKPNCGWNEEYAQTGTWIYDRANWCPGEPVYPIFHDLTSFINTNATYSIDIDMQTYQTSNVSAGWNWVSQLISYSAANHDLDVSIEDIISPTTADDYRREGPTCANPVIKIKNTGLTPITEVVFSYGVRGQTPSTYTWTTDELTFLNDTLVVLPSLSSALSSSTSTKYFDVSVVSVNGTTDEDFCNNIYASKIPSVQAMPEEFIVRLAASGPNAVTVGQTSWALNDENGNTLYSGGGAGEELITLEPGCYQFVVSDAGCDGLRFMGNSAGNLWFLKPDGASTLYAFVPDFGCGFTKYFYVADTSSAGKTNTNVNTANNSLNRNSGGVALCGSDVGIAKNSLKKTDVVQIFPNPAQDNAQIKFNFNQSQSVIYKLMDISGRVIQQKNLSNVSVSNNQTIDLTNVESGVYLVSIRLEDNSTITKKLIVQK